MAVVKKLDDAIRVKILSAMRSAGALSPNIKMIKKLTGLHRATIKSSIKFMEDKKLITGYRPLLDIFGTDQKLIAQVYLQIDTSNKAKYSQFIDIVKQDYHVVSCSEIISEGDYNLEIKFLVKNIEEFHKHLRDKYYSAIICPYEFIMKKSVFFISTPIYIYKNEIDAVVDILAEVHKQS